MKQENGSQSGPSLHPDFCYSIESIGNERQPLIVVDNFLSKAETLIDFAVQQGGVAAAAGFYPGFRSRAPALYEAVLKETLGDLMCETFNVELANIAVAESYYSVVATPTAKLKEAQQIPHFDLPVPNDLAVLHYLCSPEHGGTSFYRHRQTGYEFIDEPRIERYIKTLEGEIEEGGLPKPAAYINGDTAMFERVASKDAVFNRLLIYRCSSLHSGNIAKDYAFDMNPVTGRFTIATFLHGN